MVQFRTLGGALCFAIAASVFNKYLRAHMSSILPSEDVHAILESPEAIKQVKGVLKMELLQIFANAYNVQFKILIGFVAAQIPATLLMWQRDQILV
jgi:hypothetical protein